MKLQIRGKNGGVIGQSSRSLAQNMFAFLLIIGIFIL